MTLYLFGSALADTVPGAVGEINICEGSSLVDGVEGEEVHLFNAVPSLLRVTEHANHGGVDCVLVLHPRCPSGEQDNIVLFKVRSKDLNKATINAELIEGERASLVTAKHIHAGHLLDGGHALGDSALQ